jgi:hypothetical protein
MGQQYMKCLLVSRTSDKGFTVLEMMVGIAMTLTVSAIALAALSNAETGFSKDKGRIEGGQKLSSVLDIVGRDIVQAGEQINDPRFPVIRVIPDADLNPLTNKGSRIIIYRGLEEALSLCSSAPATNALTAGTATTTLSLTSIDPDVRTENPSCTPVRTFEPVSPATTPPTYTTTRTYPLNVQAWRTRRLAAGGQIPFFLHDTQGNIQLVNLTGETNASGFDTIGLTTSSFNAAFNFRNRSTANLLEKREYLICGTDLKVRINNSIEGNCDEDNAVTSGSADTLAFPFKTIATNITRMDITLTTAATATSDLDTPDTINTNFPCAPAPRNLCPANIATEIRDWRDLRGVAVRITAPNPDINGVQTTINASGRFYPRNILSTNAQ